MPSKERLNVLTWLVREEASHIQYMKRKKEEQRIEVTAWSWTNAALSCGVLRKACHSSDNGQNHRHAEYIKRKHPKMLLIKTFPLILGKQIPCVAFTGICILSIFSFQCAFPLSFI